MAQKWTNENIAGALHFVSGNVVNRLKIFHTENSCRAFLGVCQELREKRESKLIAFVVMPDHFHLVVNPRDGKIREWVGALKSIAARRLIDLSPYGKFGKKSKDDSEHQVWQESFKALPLWSNWMIWQKINYIHTNPVKAGLVDSAKDYQWSSFRSFYFDEKDALLQVNKDWWWHDDVQKLQKAMTEREKKEGTN